MNWDKLDGVPSPGFASLAILSRAAGEGPYPNVPRFFHSESVNRLGGHRPPLQRAAATVGAVYDRPKLRMIPFHKDHLGLAPISRSARILGPSNWRRNDEISDDHSGARNHWSCSSA